MAVVQATRKSPHYFLKHTVIVVTWLPLKSTLRSIDYTERVAKRNVVLGAFNVRCVPRTLDKGLILAGLIVQFAESPLEKEVEGHFNSLSARRNQDFAWSLDSNLWGN